MGFTFFGFLFFSYFFYAKKSTVCFLLVPYSCLFVGEKIVSIGCVLLIRPAFPAVWRFFIPYFKKVIKPGLTGEFVFLNHVRIYSILLLDKIHSYWWFLGVSRWVFFISSSRGEKYGYKIYLPNSNIRIFTHWIVFHNKLSFIWLEGSQFSLITFCWNLLAVNLNFQWIQQRRIGFYI